MPVPIAVIYPENQWSSAQFSAMIDHTVDRAIRNFGTPDDPATRARLSVSAVEQIVEYAGPAGNA